MSTYEWCFKKQFQVILKITFAFNVQKEQTTDIYLY